MPSEGASSRIPAAASAAKTRSERLREPATATASGPTNSSVTAIPSGSRSSAVKKQRFIAASTNPNSRTSRSARPASALRVGRQIAISTAAAKIVRRKTAPPGPSSSKIVVASAEPSWTERIPTITRPPANRRGSFIPAGAGPRCRLSRFAHRGWIIGTPMSILLAPDKFKGTLTAAEVAAAMADGLASSGAGSDRCPIADGGDGTAAVLLDAIGGEWLEALAHDALGRPISCRFARLATGDAVVEVAEASGLARLEGAALDPLGAGSDGTGELIAAAIRSGAERVLVACGGSATTDAGLGALEHFSPGGCGDRLPLRRRRRLRGGAALRAAEGRRRRRARAARDAAGAAADRAAARPRPAARSPAPPAVSRAASGPTEPGSCRVPATCSTRSASTAASRRATLVLTGEGAIDRTSLSGKAVGEVASRAARAAVPCHAIVGRDELTGPGRERFASIAEAGTPEAIARAAAGIVPYGFAPG